MSDPRPQMIRVAVEAPVFVTPDEYEQIIRELAARKMAGDITMADKILARVLYECADQRYHDIMVEWQYRPNRKDCGYDL